MLTVRSSLHCAVVDPLYFYLYNPVINNFKGGVVRQKETLKNMIEMLHVTR